MCPIHGVLKLTAATPAKQFTWGRTPVRRGMEYPPDPGLDIAPMALCLFHLNQFTWQNMRHHGNHGIFQAAQAHATGNNLLDFK
jgi:hypothetical protein